MSTARFNNSSMDERQRQVYAAITGGSRSTGPQHFELVAPDGTLNGPFGLMVRVPELGGPLQELGAALRYQTSLTDREREIGILSLARVTNSPFERYAHEAVGRAVGLNDDELDALRKDTFAGRNAREAAVSQLCARLGSTALIEASDLDQCRGPLTDHELIEVVVLAGYYRTIAQLMSVFGIKVPDMTPDPTNPF